MAAPGSAGGAAAATKPALDFAEQWCSLFELFVSVSGLSLRLNVPDTVIVKDGRMLGWFYTNAEGVVCRCALHDVGPEVLLRKLLSTAPLDPLHNPRRFVALCHFESGVSRLLQEAELRYLLSSMVGPYDATQPPVDPSADVPFCIQAYVIPVEDKRYLTTYGGAEQPGCTSFARRFSARYDADSSAPQPHPEQPQPAAADAAGAAGALAPPLTQEELTVERQLVAMGLLGARKPQAGVDKEPGLEEEELRHGGYEGDAVAAAPAACKEQMAQHVQAVVAFVERAHGLRIQGLVTEFVQAPSQVMVLLAVHAVQWDTQSNPASRHASRPASAVPARSSLASAPRHPSTPDLRSEYQPPTARASTHFTASPSASPLPSPSLASSPLASPTRRPLSPRHAAAWAPPALTLPPHPDSPHLARSAAATPEQPPALLLSPRSQALSPRTGVLSGGAPASPSWSGVVGGGGGASAAMQPDGSWARRASAGRAPFLHRSVAELTEGQYTVATRPGSAPAKVVRRLRPATAAAAAAAAGRVAVLGVPGGDDTAAADTYAMFADNQAFLGTDTVAGALVLEAEVLRERLARQAEVARRAEAALAQMTATSRSTQAGLLQQVHEAQAVAQAAAQGRSQVEAEVERLHSERPALTQQISTLEREVASAQDALSQDRSTLAQAVRSAASKEEGLEDLVARLRAENDHLNQQVGALERRLEEEGEVVQAARNQLYDYRQMVGLLQNQLRRGKNKPAGATGASATPAAGVTSPGIAPPTSTFFTAGGPNSFLATASASPNQRVSAAVDVADVGADGVSTSGAGGRIPSKSSLPARLSVNAAGGGSSVRASGNGRILSKYDTAPAHRFQAEAPPGSEGGADPPTSPGPRAGSWRSQAPPQGINVAAAMLASAGGAGGPLSPLSQPITQLSPRTAGRLQQQQLQQGWLTALPGFMPQTPTQQQQMILSLMSPPTDGIAAAITELRHARKYGGNQESGNPFLGGQGGADGCKEGAASHATGAKQVVTMSDKKKRVQNPWKPNYEALHLNDLLVMNGELTERMTETLQHVITLLKGYEAEFFEMYTYSASLGAVKIIDDKLIMVPSQFMKFARSVGLAEGPSLDLAEEYFHQVSERVTTYLGEFSDSPDWPRGGEFVTFPEFPELVCRLAAARFEWRPPEGPEEADEDIEQPEALRAVPLANISELPNANHYGVGPTAKLPAAAAAAAARTSVSGGPRPPALRPRSGVAALRPGSARAQGPQERGSEVGDGGGSVLACVSELGPQPADVVLYTIIKTFIELHLLPRAKRNRTMGSRDSKARASQRTLPDTVWT